jgi:hypothetical protein
VSGEESLRLLERLEALHLPLASSRRPVRVFGTIVEVAAGAMSDVRQDGTLGNAVAAQSVRDQAPRSVPQTVQQAFEETLRGRAVPPLLHQDVQHHAVLVHRAPQVVQHAPDPDEDLVEVPSITRPRSPAAEPTGEVGTELAAPVSDALAGDDHATLGQD